MQISVEITNVIVDPEFNAAEIIITPNFSSGDAPVVNVPIETISVNGMDRPIIDKNVDITVPTKTSNLEKDDVYTKTEVDNKLTAIYEFKGSVPTYDELPIDAENADVWNVEENGVNYAWVDSTSNWDSLGGVVGLATLTENGLLSKEDFAKLQNLSGTNTGDETQTTIGALIDAAELTEITDTSKIAASNGGVLNWFSGLRIKNYLTGYFAKVSDYFSKVESNRRFVSQDGGTIYHTTKWFTPTASSTFSSVETIVTLAGSTQLTAAMIGSKIGPGTQPNCDLRIIIAVGTNNTCTINEAFDVNYSGRNDWGVYSINRQNVGGTIFYIGTGGQALYNISNGTITITRSVDVSGFEFLFRNGLRGASTTYFGYSDVQFMRNAAGVFEVNNGTAGQYRDLILQNLNKTGYDYFAVSATADTINDRRTSNVAGVKIEERCTAVLAGGANVKGSGTWIITKISAATKSLTNNVLSNLLEIQCANNKMQCGWIHYSLSFIDTVNNTVRSHVGMINYNVRNQNGVVTSNVVHSTAMENDLGIITDSWILTNGTAKATLSLTANAAGMTPTSATIFFDIKNQGSNNILLL